MSRLVYAEKWELHTPVRGSGGDYKKDGDKSLVSKGKMVSRDMVESYNSQPNNIIFVIDEEKTKEMNELREANLVSKSEVKTKGAKSSEEVMAEALVKALGKASGSEVDEELDDLLEEAKELGLVIKGRKTIKSVQKKIDEFKKANE